MIVKKDMTDKEIHYRKLEIMYHGALTNEYYKTTNRVRGSVAEETVQHLLSRQARLLTKGTRDVGNHLGLDFPDKDKIRENSYNSRRPGW